MEEILGGLSSNLLLKARLALVFINPKELELFLLVPGRKG